MVYPATVTQAPPVDVPEPDAAHAVAPRGVGRVRATLRYLRRNPKLVAGLTILLGLVLFWLVGSRVVDTRNARPMSPRASSRAASGAGASTGGASVTVAG